MTDFIANYGGTVLVAAIVALAVSSAIRKIIRDRKKGKGSCSCGCEGCAFSDKCHKSDRDQ